MKSVGVPLNRPFIRGKIFSWNSNRSKAMRTQFDSSLILYSCLYTYHLAASNAFHAHCFCTHFTQLQRKLSNLLIWIIYSLVRRFLFIALALRTILVVTTATVFIGKVNGDENEFHSSTDHILFFTLLSNKYDYCLPNRNYRCTCTFIHTYDGCNFRV